MDIDCLCHSKKKYKECCQPFHTGLKLPNPIELMRSRYSAYALGLFEYIQATTHQDHDDFKKLKDRWKEEIKMFHEATDFIDLKIIESEIKENEAHVTFEAFLKQDGQPVSFKEKSLFLKENGKWLYRSGNVVFE